MCVGICKRQSFRRNRYSDPGCICNHYSDPSDFGNHSLFWLAKTASQMNMINLLPVEFTLDSWKYLLGEGGILETVFDFGFLDSDRCCDRVGN